MTARQSSMVWTERSKRTTAQLAEARRLESTGRRSDARRAQALCWAVAVAHDELSRRWAERWGSRAVPIEDRRQTARIGMYRSALRYDPARGVPFAVTLLDVLPAEAPEEYADWRDVQRAVACIDRLPERHRMVLRLRYGLETGEPMNLREVGQLLGGVSRELMRREEMEGLAAVRRMLDGEPVPTVRDADARLLAYVRAHPGCTLGAAALAACVDNRTVRPMIERLGIEIRQRPPPGRRGLALYAPEGGGR